MPTAIDIHVHPPNRPGVPLTPFQEGERAQFKPEREITDPDELYQYYKDRDQIATLLAFDDRSTYNSMYAPNDWVAELAQRHPDHFIGFGSVDPHMGKIAVREARRCVEELGLKGFKFHPVTQEFAANDTEYYELWGTIADLGVPALFHSGHTAVGFGFPGQAGMKNKYGAPYPYFDDLAADFPELTIILAHPSFPWVDEQISVCTLKPNVYLDLSGWSPKYFSKNLVQYCSTVLSSKALYGSDWPGITPDRWLREFAQVPFKDEARPKILLENAQRVLKLEF
jgi:predicted TIM-barrel fold metal-dependent hydrolase